MSLHRRRFLQAAGLGAGSLFLPSLLSGRRAAGSLGATARAADAPEPPMRLLILYTEQGVPLENWAMRPPSMPASQAWELSLADRSEGDMSPCLRPLYRHRNKMIVVDGLALATAFADPYGDAHAKGWCSSLTGGVAREQFEESKSRATHVSLDQLIAADLRARVPELTDLVSLEYGINEGNFHDALYRAGAGGAPVERIPHEELPFAAKARLFPRGDVGTPPDPVRSARRELLGDLAGLYDRTATRLSSEDRRKLSAHRDLLLDTERRLRFLETLDCRPPAVTYYPTDKPTDPPLPPLSERMLPYSRSFFDLASVAFACQMSRVVTLQWGEMPVSLIGGTGDLHEGYAHPSGRPSDKNHVRGLEVMTNQTALHATWAAELCDQLDAIPEGDGTLLDHTIVLWVGELGNGSHALDDWPVVILGGGKRFRTGRYLHVARDTPTTSVSQYDRDTDLLGTPHNHLLVSIAQAMGVQTDTVGLASLKARRAGVPDIDLRGPLAGLV